MSIEINHHVVNSAGEDLIIARCMFMRGQTTEAHLRICQARDKLLRESIWLGDGHDQVQAFYEFAEECTIDHLKITKMDLSIPAAMIYFGRKLPNEMVEKRITTANKLLANMLKPSREAVFA